MIDQGGRTQWSAQTTAYGRVRLNEGTRAECPFRFQGQYEDTETGLYYNRFRYYDPQEGTYINQDLIGLRGGQRLYSYVSNPTAYIDILGLSGSAFVVIGEGQKAVDEVTKQLIAAGHNVESMMVPNNQ